MEGYSIPMSALSLAAIVIGASLAYSCLMLLSVYLFSYPKCNPLHWLSEAAEEAASDPSAFNLYFVFIFGPLAWAMFAHYAYQKGSGRAERRRNQERLNHPERYAPYKHFAPWI